MGEIQRDKIDRMVENTLDRLSGQTIVCPDCGETIDTVRVERIFSRIERINFGENGKGTVFVNGHTEAWGPTGEITFRCPKCDSLNIPDFETRWW